MNRRWLLDRLSCAVARVRAGTEGATLLVADINDFKRINQCLGLSAGDRALFMFGHALRGVVGVGGNCARLESDRFACLLLGVVDEVTAVEMAERLRVVANEELTSVARGFRPGVTVGAVVLRKSFGNANHALQAAEAAVTEARANGDGICVYTEALRKRDARREELSADLTGALARAELELHYQPLYSLQTGGVVAVEALLRWKRGGRESVSPEEFIPLLERSGQIVDVGTWVLRTGCQQLRQWHDAGHSKLRLAVNLSARQFNDHLLFETVAEAIAASGVPPSTLELELTEGTLVDDVRGASERLRELGGRLGVRLAIDDFGTGYSSLAYLRRFPFDTLKVDRLFVGDCASSAASASILTGIIQLGHSLGMRVVAEGIETPEQLRLLSERGCDIGQGFGLHRPAPAAAVAMDSGLPETPRFAL
jgi:diguanylate cyclase (GGDEF)-like protein